MTIKNALLTVAGLWQVTKKTRNSTAVSDSAAGKPTGTGMCESMREEKKYISALIIDQFVFVDDKATIFQGRI